jgi:GntR family transcriptional repressor for pyruvate dehydrogenase complex
MPRTDVADGSKKTHELVAEQIRRQIVTGELQVGERLPPEEELTQVFGVARTTLREALRVLESQGLLEIRRGRGGGPVVTQPDLEPAATALAVSLQLQHVTLGDLDATRRIIEPEAAAMLARNHTPAALDALNEAIDHASAAAEADDTVAFGEAAVRVHEAVLENTGSPTFGTLSRLLHQLVRGYYATRASRSDQKLMRRAVRSYRKLVALVEAGDDEAAKQHWHKQMLYTGDSRADEPLTVII